MEAVERQLTRYSLQDLRCVKCRRVATLSMADVCKCSGKLVGDELPKEFEDLMGILRRVALHFNLPWLKETVDHALRILPEDEEEEEQQHEYLLEAN